jgi:flagellar biogenesis protein FliO
MFSLAKQPGAPGRRKNWLTLGGVAIAVVLAGLLTPYFLPDATQAQEKTPAGATAAPPGDLKYQPPDWPEAPSPGAMLLRLGIGTAVVLLLCVITIWAGKRWLKGNAASAAAGGKIQLVETFPLGGRCVLHLVRVGASQVLVAADGSGLKSMLSVADFADELALRDEPATQVSERSGQGAATPAATSVPPR